MAAKNDSPSDRGRPYILVQVKFEIKLNVIPNPGTIYAVEAIIQQTAVCHVHPLKVRIQVDGPMTHYIGLANVQEKSAYPFATQAFLYIPSAVAKS